MEMPSALFYLLCGTLRMKISNESGWDDGKIGIINSGRITKWLILWWENKEVIKTYQTVLIEILILSLVNQ